MRNLFSTLPIGRRIYSERGRIVGSPPIAVPGLSALAKLAVIGSAAAYAPLCRDFPVSWGLRLPHMRSTLYFQLMRERPDRAAIDLAWIDRCVLEPLKESAQPDGGIRRWGLVPEANGKYLRVVLLANGETVHNAFFDRGFVL